MALGDNFYGPNVNQAGPANDTDPQWNNRYRDVYTGAGTFIPWYAILGNHDYYLPGNSYAQIEFYKNHRDNRWNMPDHNYTKCWEFQGQTLQIVFIDTVRLNPAIANVNILTPPKPLALQMAQSEQHLAWIEATLAASTADWLIVAGHYNSENTIVPCICYIPCAHASCSLHSELRPGPIPATSGYPNGAIRSGRVHEWPRSQLPGHMTLILPFGEFSVYSKIICM